MVEIRMKTPSIVVGFLPLEGIALQESSLTYTEQNRDQAEGRRNGQGRWEQRAGSRFGGRSAVVVFGARASLDSPQGMRQALWLPEQWMPI